MARTAYKATLGTNLGDGQFLVDAAASPDTADDVATAVAALATLTTNVATAKGADNTAVDNAISTLVADGATPTQAHVTTLNTAWTTLKADIAALSTTATSAALTSATTHSSANFFLSVDTAVVTSGNALRRLVDAFLRAAQASGML